MLIGFVIAVLIGITGLVLMRRGGRFRSLGKVLLVVAGVLVIAGLLLLGYIYFNIAVLRIY